MGPTWKNGNSKIFRPWLRIRTHLARSRLGLSGAPSQPFNNELPLRAELFSTDQMEQHGVRLASTHRLNPRRVPDQLLPWVPGPDGRLRNNPLSALSRWKLLDNLRRSLVPAVLTLLLLLGWTVFSSTAFWTLAVLGVLVIPPVLASLVEVFRKPDDMRLGQHLAAGNEDCRRAVRPLLDIWRVRSTSQNGTHFIRYGGKLVAGHFERDRVHLHQETSNAPDGWTVARSPCPK